MALAALTLAVGSCSDNLGLSPTGQLSPEISSSLSATALDEGASVRISEIHYDNVSTDTDEKIEISGPAGMVVTGWRLVLYNGNGGTTYGVTHTLSGSIPATCDEWGVLVFTYPVNGVQNGSSSATATNEPDGVALIDGAGNVVEFLSYEGAFTATNGPAVGRTSIDIGVRELGNEPINPVWSVKRNGLGIWDAPSASNFGICNDKPLPPPPIASVTVTPNSATIVQNARQQFSASAFDVEGNRIAAVTFAWSSSSPEDASVSDAGLVTGHQIAEKVTITATAPNGVAGTATLRVDAAPPPPTIVINELMAEPANASGGASWGEWFEVHNYGAAPLNLKGWMIASGGTSQPDHAINADLIVAAGGYAVLGRGNDPARNGGIALDYNYFVGTSTTIWLDNSDFLELRNAAGVQVDRVQWTSVARGVTRALRDATHDNLDVDGANWGYTTIQFGDGDLGTPRAANGTLSNTPPSLPGRIAFSGRDPSGDPALPVGFQDQLFATVTDANGATDTRPVTWASVTPEIASIDERGVITALAAGMATVRATAADGITTATFSLPTRIATPSTIAQYGANIEFGMPKDGNASDDFIISYTQYTASYNKTKGTPNWVSYNIDATHFGPEDRCDCFTFDQNLPSDFSRYTTADYTGAGAFHGYSIDRGHLARSFDRTSGSLDNAHTFYFTNIIPQAADNNQGPWSKMENYLGDLARLQNRDVYVVAGVAGSKGTVKDEGKITIPAYVWKVSLIMPRDRGLANVHSLADVEVVAAIMPNDPGIRDADWEAKYKTTVDAVEALSGYNLLDLLPDQIEIAVESNTRPPVARLDGPYVSLEGSGVTMSAASSTDPDSDPLSYRWDLGDGTTKHGAIISHTYAQDGTYDVRLTVTDPLGLVAATSTTTAVSNVAPVISIFSGATLLPGETYTTVGSFTDPGADRWTAMVDYGDGSGQQPLVLAGKTYSLSHTYATPGAFTVTVRISDDDVTTTRAQSVVVQTPAQGAEDIIDAVDHLARSGALNGGNANALTSKLSGAVKQLEAKKITPAVNELESFINQVGALERSDRLSAAQATPLRSGAQRVIRSVSP